MYKELASKFALNFCSDSLDYSKDMMGDSPGEYTNYNETKTCLEDSIESFSEACLEDFLADFSQMVREEVRKKKIVVESITFTEDGYSESSERIINEFRG